MSELVKLFSCLWLVYNEEGSSFLKLKEAVHNQIIKQPLDTLKVCVPSMVYVVQNNLLYVAASHLDAATYQVSMDNEKKTGLKIIISFLIQVTYQLKILTTALFTVAILRRQLIATQWTALVVLLVGVAMVQLAQTEPEKASKSSTSGPEQHRWVGFGAALAACVLSGFAGIYFEKILKVRK